MCRQTGSATISMRFHGLSKRPLVIHLENACRELTHTHTLVALSRVHWDSQSCCWCCYCCSDAFYGQTHTTHTHEQKIFWRLLECLEFCVQRKTTFVQNRFLFIFVTSSFFVFFYSLFISLYLCLRFFVLVHLPRLLALNSHPAVLSDASVLWGTVRRFT